ncbi:MAG TPA: flippase [Cellvibrio sp.]|nr:flippase [Cellvibrio sp.]
MSLSKNTFWNIAGNALPLVLGAVTIPLLIPALGLERFGVLTLLWTIIGYFSLFDFGLGRAITQQVATSLGEQRQGEIPQIIKAGLEFTVLTGLLGALVLTLGAYPLSHYGMGVSTDLRQEVFISLLIAAIGIPLATLSNGLRGALEGYERFQASNVARMLLGASIFLFPLLAVLLHGKSLVTVTLWLVGARLLSCLLFVWLVAKLPSGKFWHAPILENTRKRLFSFGAWMAVTNLLSPLLVNADRFFISYLLGAGVVAYYTVPFEFLVRLLILPGALGASLLPNLARERLMGSALVGETFAKSVKIVSLAMAALCLIAALLAYPLMNMFISEDFASKSWLLAVILSVGVLINGVAYLPYTALHAYGKAKPTGILHLVEFVVYIPMLFAFIHWMGLTGAALAWTLRVAWDAIALFWLWSKERGRNVFA